MATAGCDARASRGHAAVRFFGAIRVRPLPGARGQPADRGVGGARPPPLLRSAPVRQRHGLLLDLSSSSAWPSPTAAATSVGVSGKPLAFNSMSLANLMWGPQQFFWNGRAATLEEQALVPIRHAG